MSRLTDRPVATIQEDRLTAAQTFARSRNITLVLKGNRTLIAFADGRVWVNPTGSPAMATGGTGDILTGMTAGLLAQFPDQADLSTAAAVYWHGLAGEVAAGDVPSIGAAAPTPAPAGALSTAAAPADCPLSIQTIANAYADYTRRSLQEGRSFAEKLMGVRSFDNAIEVQTDFARQTLANFIAESQQICELYGKLATQIFRPWEGLVAKVSQAGRQMP